VGNHLNKVAVGEPAAGSPPFYGEPGAHLRECPYSPVDPIWPSRQRRRRSVEWLPCSVERATEDGRALRRPLDRAGAFFVPFQVAEFHFAPAACPARSAIVSPWPDPANASRQMLSARTAKVPFVTGHSALTIKSTGSAGRSGVVARTPIHLGGNLVILHHR
jgi:hypothetical protein